MRRPFCSHEILWNENLPELSPHQQVNWPKEPNAEWNAEWLAAAVLIVLVILKSSRLVARSLQRAFAAAFWRRPLRRGAVEHATDPSPGDGQNAARYLPYPLHETEQPDYQSVPGQAVRRFGQAVRVGGVRHLRVPGRPGAAVGEWGQGGGGEEDAGGIRIAAPRTAERADDDDHNGGQGDADNVELLNGLY